MAAGGRGLGTSSTRARAILGLLPPSMQAESSRRSRSPLSSPQVKRRRTQSPEIEFEEVTQDEIAALEVYEASQSQRTFGSSQSVRHGYSAGHLKSDETTHDSSSDDPFGSEKPSSIKPPCFASAAMFTRAAHLPIADELDFPSSSQPAGTDYDSWFNDSEIPDTSFKSAVSLTTGFQTASKGILAPSTEALAKAQALLRKWDEPDENLDVEASSSPPSAACGNIALFQTASSLPVDTPSRPALRSVQNLPPTPESPSPAVFTRLSARSSSLKANPKAFKSPLMKPIHSKPTCTSPSKSQNIASSSTFVTPARPKHPLAAAPINASSSPNTASSTTFSTPLLRPTAFTLRSTPAKFVTPFKKGMRPGEPGHISLMKKAPTRVLSSPFFSPASASPLLHSHQTSRKPKIKPVFDMRKPLNRLTLETCGMTPRWYSLKPQEMPQSIIRDLEQMHPSIAPYFAFFGPPPNEKNDSGEMNVRIGPQEAFERLKAEGCSLLTREWVDNHWGLILWKLAGHAHLDPEREWYDDQKRWGWEEVRSQLLYRYEREINQGIRPPLRLMATQDSACHYPLVLCVSNIIWLEQSKLPDGKQDARAELELTDGWYKIRAQIDAPLLRAINKRTIRVGRKIAIVGAKLDSERKDPQEILEAYNSIKLVITGNSSHLAPWHTKLGFQRELPIATMSSLTRDGGMIAAMEFEIQKVHPIAFLEFIYEDNKRITNGPFEEKEEMRLRDQWQRKRENEYSKLREVNEKNFQRYSGYAERLERKAGSSFRPTEAGPPDRIDDYYDELEEPEDAPKVIARVTSSDAGWLAIQIRSQMDKQRDIMSEAMDKELNELCPPRDVRSFRVLGVRDADRDRRPANRVALVTVWDVMNVCLSEGRKPGTFEVGERCRVTHLMPTQLSSWMGHTPEAQIFMCSTRRTRFTKLKAE